MRRSTYLARTFAMALVFLPHAVSQDAMEIAPDEVQAHRVGQYALLRSKSKVAFGDHVTLQVIVDADGSVESAHCVPGHVDFCRDAEAAELKQKFKPFEKDGLPIGASFTDEVPILPAEQWADDKLPFPEISDLSTLKIGLQRTGCYGFCPAYSVEVRGNGEVEFTGKTYVLITGHHSGKISKEALAGLLAEFKKADYFSLRDTYASGVTDNPTYTTSIEFDGQTKTVTDYAGLHAGMPGVVDELEKSIDQAAGSAKWIEGNAQTGAALLAENWNFHADTEENRALFANVVTRGPEALIDLFVAQGAPALGMTKDGESALVSAARKGDVGLVKTILDRPAKPSEALLSCALAAGAQRGSLELVRFLLKQGANPNGQLCGRFARSAVVIAAAGSGNPAVLEEILQYHPDIHAKDNEGASALAVYVARNGAEADLQKGIALLLANGADVNSRDDSGRTPLFNACGSDSANAVRLLARAGADLNARDQNGQTVLMSCFENKVLEALVSAGADVTIRDPSGRTAAETARQMGVHDKAELLDRAASQKPTQ